MTIGDHNPPSTDVATNPTNRWLIFDKIKPTQGQMIDRYCEGPDGQLDMLEPAMIYDRDSVRNNLIVIWRPASES